MAVKKVTKEVNYCDVCGRESPILTKCPICKRENCYTCSSQVYDVWHTNICLKCLENKDINAYFMSEWKDHWGKDREAVIKEMIKRFYT